MARWWLSFATPDACLGVIITEAASFGQAHLQVSLLGIKPEGGECAGVYFDDARLAQLPERLQVALRALPLDHLLSPEVLAAMPELEARSLRDLEEADHG